MKFQQVSAFAVFLILGGAPAPSFADSTSRPVGSGRANAAVIYREAFSLLPGHGKDQDRGPFWYADPFEAERAITFLNKHQRAIELFREATSIKECDWGRELRGNAMGVASQNTSAGILRDLMQLKVQVLLRERRYDEAFADLVRLLTFSFHLGSGGPLVSRMSQDTFFEFAAEQACENLLDAPPAVVRTFYGSIRSLPAWEPYAAAARPEGPVSVEYLKNELAKNPTETLRQLKMSFEMVGSLNAIPPKPNETRWNKFEAALLDPIRRAKALEGLGRLYEKMADVLSLPEAQFDAAGKTCEAEAASEPFGWMIPLRAMYNNERNHFVSRVLFVAAVAVCADGKNALAGIPDPAGTGPFEYVQTKSGFQLRSKRIGPARQPLTIEAGHPAE